MLEIVKLNSSMEKELESFFIDVSNKDGYTNYYYPYTLTQETAKELCNLSGKDLHYVLKDNNKILGHGMLRGWDEGYDIPSLGIVIHPNVSNRGLGTMFVRFLHSAAWLRGCSKIRLSVHKNNKTAFNIYKKLGYVFVSKNKEELTGILLKREFNYR